MLAGQQAGKLSDENLQVFEFFIGQTHLACLNDTALLELDL